MPLPYNAPSMAIFDPAIHIFSPILAQITRGGNTAAQGGPMLSYRSCTLCLARQAKRAVGVELVGAAIRDAQENARRNGIGNAEFFCADAGQAAQRLCAAGETPDVIVVDPPRKGLSADVIEAMARMAPQRIVYVSCDPATLARDVRSLTQQGYALTHAEAVDLFPRCAHVETVCRLERVE